jgi:hypothetical protein
MTLKVNDDYRKNELSFIPGGTSLTIHHKNGKKLTYDKIKNIKAYVKRTILNKDVCEIWQGDILIWKRG